MVRETRREEERKITREENMFRREISVLSPIFDPSPIVDVLSLQSISGTLSLSKNSKICLEQSHIRQKGCSGYLYRLFQNEEENNLKARLKVGHAVFLKDTGVFLPTEALGLLSREKDTTVSLRNTPCSPSR